MSSTSSVTSSRLSDSPKSAPADWRIPARLPIIPPVALVVPSSEWFHPVPHPDELVEVGSPTAIAFARSAVADWVGAILSRGVTLHEAAARDPQCRPMRGRGTVYLIEVDGVQCVVRRYLRGGGMRFLGDRYLRVGRTRPAREAAASDEAILRGIPTPRVLAWAVYPAGPFYRADLITEFMPGSKTLAAMLFEEATPVETRREILSVAGKLVMRIASAGLHHTDLNARNILLQRVDDRYEAAVLDLDRMAVNPHDGRPVDPAGMMARLERSIRKLTPETSEGLTSGEWDVLRAAMRSAGDVGGAA